MASITLRVSVTFHDVLQTVLLLGVLWRGGPEFTQEDLGSATSEEVDSRANREGSAR
jgi:hypothetical protein